MSANLSSSAADPQLSNLEASVADVGQQLYRAALGPVNADRYLNAFARLDATGRLLPSWNWAAAVCPPAWMVFRRLWLELGAYLAGLAVLLLAGWVLLRVGAGLPAPVLAGVLLAGGLLACVLPGLYGDVLVYRQVRRRVAQVVDAAPTISDAVARLERQAATKNWLLAVAAGAALLALAALAALWLAMGDAVLDQGPDRLVHEPVEPAGLAPAAAPLPQPPAPALEPTTERALETAMEPATEPATAPAAGAAAGSSDTEPSAALPATTPAPEAAPPAAPPETAAAPAIAPAALAAVPPGAPPAASAAPPAAAPARSAPPAQPTKDTKDTKAAKATRAGKDTKAAKASRPAPTPEAAKEPSAAPAAQAEAARAGAAEAAATQKRRLYINVGTFANRDNAQRAHAQLLLAGLPSRTQEIRQKSGRRLQRVRVGPFETASEANEAAARVRELGLEGVPAVAAD